MSEIPDCTSEKFWWPIIIELANSYEKIIIENFGIVQLDHQKLDDALNLYKSGWWRFKEHIYMRKAEKARLDMHKIIALYILSFLITEPFRACIPDTENNDNDMIFLINEYFCLDIMRALISACAKKDEAFQMSENDIHWFIVLLNNIKLKYVELNTQVISPDHLSDKVDILSLAQIVYYIEKSCIHSGSR